MLHRELEGHRKSIALEGSREGDERGDLKSSLCNEVRRASPSGILDVISSGLGLESSKIERLCMSYSPKQRCSAFGSAEKQMSQGDAWL